jgi:hypothetical protein
MKTVPRLCFQEKGLVGVNVLPDFGLSAPDATIWTKGAPVRDERTENMKGRGHK